MNTDQKFLSLIFSPQPDNGNLFKKLDLLYRNLIERRWVGKNDLIREI